MIKNDVLLNEEIDPKLVSWDCFPNQLLSFVENCDCQKGPVELKGEEKEIIAGGIIFQGSVLF